MLLALLLACTDSDDSNRSDACTEMGCIDGFTVNFVPPLMGKGTYTFDVTPDGTTYSCAVTIPLEGASTVCGTGGVVSIFLSGTELDPSQQSIPGLHIEGTPKLVEIDVQLPNKDGHSLSHTPKYQVVQPNGPDCEPTCHSASVDMATK